MSAEASDALQAARAQIDALNAVLAVDATEAAAGDYQTRYNEILPVVQAVYDAPTMARLMVGRQAWSDFDTDQRRDLAMAIEKLSVSAYASRFNTLTAQQFSVTDTAEGPRNTVVVTTKIEPDQRDSVDIAYILRDNDGRWQIIDVFINGQYSEVARRRSDFSAVLRDDGLEGLLARIDELVANYRDDFQTQPGG
ncbi:MAG: ABC transporter substrate-binding protein [Pseudomonadota bacterium]